LPPNDAVVAINPTTDNATAPNANLDKRLVLFVVVVVVVFLLLLLLLGADAASNGVSSSVFIVFVLLLVCWGKSGGQTEIPVRERE